MNYKTNNVVKYWINNYDTNATLVKNPMDGSGVTDLHTSTGRACVLRCMVWALVHGCGWPKVRVFNV